MTKKTAKLKVVSTKKEDQRVSVNKTYKLCIAGGFPRSESGRYYALNDKSGKLIANVCQASRKDLRGAVNAARNALPGWSSRTAYNRGQILYRLAEMLEGRKSQFVEELQLQGVPHEDAVLEVNNSVDRLVYFAGWTDKYQQIFGAVNPVSTSHFNFSVLEPVGVVTLIAPQGSALLGLVSTLAPAIAGGNTAVVLSSEKLPLSSITFGEVMATSDLPAGVVNILTGYEEELYSHIAGHMDINSVVYCRDNKEHLTEIQKLAANNIKRIVKRNPDFFSAKSAESPHLIMDTQEIKTTWHPVGK